MTWFVCLFKGVSLIVKRMSDGTMQEKKEDTNRTQERHKTRKRYRKDTNKTQTRHSKDTEETELEVKMLLMVFVIREKNVTDGVLIQ